MTDRSGRRWRCRSLKAPADFRYEDNPDGVLAFVYELRRQVFFRERFNRGSRKKPGFYIDLNDIMQIDLEGALILAAELDRVRLVFKIRPVLADGDWQPHIRAILHALGLHRIIEASRLFDNVPLEDWASEAAEYGVMIVPFESDTEADGAKAKALRDSVYGHCEPPTASRRPLYDSLFEAVLNAVQHAYLADVPCDGLPRVNRWWAGALVDKREGYLYLVVYDQGVGIPATLPRRDFWSIIQGKLPEFTDAAVIEGALEYGRSSTEKAGRGNGLWRICALTEAFEEAEVSFTSLKGQVHYAKGGAVERATLATRFCGTMIRWRAKVSAQEQPQ